MIKKFIPHILLDTKFQLHALVLALILILLVLQMNIIGSQHKELAKIKKEKALLKEFADIDRSSLPKPEVSIADQTYIFEGLMMEENQTYIVINGKVYKKGDLLNNYTIVDANSDKVTLVDQSTNDTKILYLKKPDNSAVAPSL